MYGNSDCMCANWVIAIFMYSAPPPTHTHTLSPATTNINCTVFDPDQLDVQPTTQVEVFQKSAQPLKNTVSEDTIKLINGILLRCHDYYKVQFPMDLNIIIVSDILLATNTTCILI